MALLFPDCGPGDIDAARSSVEIVKRLQVRSNDARELLVISFVEYCIES